MAGQVMKHFQKPWQLLVSVCVSRLNLISKELNAIEQQYAKLQEELEYERSVLNDYEVRRLELIKKDALKTNKLSEKDEALVLEASRELANIQDQEEIWASNIKNLELSTRISDSHSNNLSSTNRKVDEVLHLFVKDNDMFKEPYMIYPYTNIQEKETLHEASMRVIKKYSLDHPNLLFLSNTPAGFVKITYNEHDEKGKLYQGAKMFFTKAIINTKKEINMSSPSNNYEWLTSDEFQGVAHQDYFRKIKMFAF